MAENSYDKRIYDTIFAEVGGGPIEEVVAVGSTFLNLSDKLGYERALKRSSAYNKRSSEYTKAATGKMTPYEKAVYDRNKRILQGLLDNPETRQPWTHFENINAFGEPPWAGDMEEFKDIGRQRFYIEKQRPRVRALKSGR